MKRNISGKRKRKGLVPKRKKKRIAGEDESASGADVLVAVTTKMEIRTIPRKL